MTKQIILRDPNGVLRLETDNIDVMQNFINWIIKCNHFSEYDEENGIFTFSHSKFLSICFIKSNKIWCSELS